MDTSEYITLADAAIELHCDIETLRRAARAKKLETRKPGRARITTRQWLQTWLDNKEKQAK